MWILIIGVAAVVIVLGVVYALLADPQEVDSQETASVERETAAERKRELSREGALAEKQAERLRAEDPDDLASTADFTGE